MENYTRIHWEDRLKIEVLVRAGHNKTEIAALIGKHRTSVSRELKRGEYVHRNSDWTEEIRYSPELAEEKYQKQLQEKGREIKLGKDHELARYIEEKIVKKKYSPYAVVQKIKQEGKKFTINICRATIYNYIKKGVFFNLTEKELPLGGKAKRKKKNNRRRKRASSGTSIEMRPESVDTREEFGHWEMDTVVGKQGVSKKSFLVLTERKTRKEIIEILKEHTAKEVVRVMDKIERQWGGAFKKIFKSITVDNGTEFSDAEGLERARRGKKQRTSVFYCHPYSSYERASNENQNKLIRRHVPKGTDLDNISRTTVKEVENWINEYPRELFGGITSNILFKNELKKLML